MTNTKKVLIVQVGFFLLVISSFSLAEDPTSEKQLIETLEYIARGFETHMCSIGSVHIVGRIFHEQRGIDGQEIPKEKIYSPQWINYEYIHKNGKRRYVQDRLSMSDKQYYALDNNKRLLTYATNIVQIYPLHDEESQWFALMPSYGDFFRLTGVKGYENVGLAMRSLMQEIQSGKFNQSGWNVSIKMMNKEGFFTITVRKNEKYIEEFKIDSHKGFNLVELKKLYPSTKFWVEMEGQYEYEQLKTGQWILAKGEIKGTENGVFFEKCLETSKIQTDYEAPDDLFELESLNIPHDVYTVDHQFSPPLEYNEGGHTSKELEFIDHLDELTNCNIKQTEIAEVGDKGQITINTHQAFIDHDASSSKIENDNISGKYYWTIIVFALIVVVVGMLFILIYHRLKGQV